MTTTVTLKQGIAQAFNLDGRSVPEFKSSKPLKEAREWLERQGIEYTYEVGQFGVGLVAFTRGAGSPQYTVVTDENEVNTPGNAPIAVLAPKYHSKSEQRRVEATRAAKIENDDVESTPTITNSPESEANSETTVTEPKTTKRRGLRRK